MGKNKPTYFYIAIFFAVTVAIFCVVICVNFFIDPYNELGRNRIGLYFLSDRQLKNRINTFPHDALMMGSSRVANINPQELCGYHFYNASFASALPEEMYFYLEKYATHQKLVMIGLDFYMFNESEYPLSQMKKWPDHYFAVHEYLLSWNVFRDSFIALKKWARREPPLLDINGRMNRGDSASSAEPAFDPKEYNKWMKHLRGREFHPARLSKVRMIYLERIKDLLDKRNIKHIFFINPIQEDVYALIKNSGSYDDFDLWRRTLKERFPEIRDLTQGRYFKKSFFMINDPSHYKAQTGAQFINEILDEIPCVKK